MNSRIDMSFKINDENLIEVVMEEVGAGKGWEVLITREFNGMFSVDISGYDAKVFMNILKIIQERV